MVLPNFDMEGVIWKDEFQELKNDIDVELLSLQQYLFFLEKYLPNYETMEREKLEDMYRLFGIEGAKFVSTDIKLRVEQEITPRYVRNQYVVALWACFELLVEKITEVICSIASHWALPSIPLNKLKGGFLTRVKIFFEYGDQDTFHQNYLDDDFIKCIEFVRNKIAHGNSRSDILDVSERNRLDKYLRNYEDLIEDRNGFILVNERFCHKALGLIIETISTLFEDLIEYASDAQR